MRTCEQFLRIIDGNDKMKNKTGTQCWDILKSELDCVINRYVPMKKQGKHSKKNNQSKEAFKKIIYINKMCGGFINIRKRIKIVKFSKIHETQQQMRLESPSEIVSTN